MPSLGQVDRVRIEQRLEFAALPEGWLAVGALALAVGLVWVVVWMYRHEGRAGASLRVRMLMAGLRSTAFLLLLTIWLQPVWATYLHRWIDSYTLVLVDTSSSMDLQDRYRAAGEIERVKPIAGTAGEAPLRRTAVVDALLQHDNRRLLRDLAENNRVRVCTFAEAPKTAYTVQAAREKRFVAEEDADSTDAILPLNALSKAQTVFPAQGSATDLGLALRQGVEAVGRAPVAGVVVLTDGAINRGDSVDAVARFARDRKLPLHVVGIGDPSPPRNARVAEIVAPESAFAEDPFAVIAQVSAQGLSGETVAVELREREAESGGDGRVIATREVTFADDNVPEALTFEHRQRSPGRYVYQVRIPADETESVADDNAKQLTVNIIENRLRVLLVSGAPSWEYRYLMRLLQRDETFALSCWLQSADDDAVRDGNIVIDHLPASPEEMFAYDAVILLDPDPLEFTTDFSALLARLVSQHGGGLLLAAARLHTPDFLRDPAADEVVRILPVTLDPDADLLLNQIGHFQKRPAPLVVEPNAAGHPILKHAEGELAQRWEEIAPVYWYYPVLREKPVATVLFRHGDPRMRNAYGGHVLLATQYVGAGRAAFLAFDGTWRWRATSEAVFNRFWVQTLRYLVEGKLAGGNRRGALFTEKDTYQLGEAVPVSARVFDASYQPLTAVQVRAEYRIDGVSEPFTLTRLADRPGWYEGRFAPGATGSCELLLPIPDADVGNLVARREIQIVRPNLEIVQPRMNRELLTGLAEQTPGGAYYDVGTAHALAEAIPDRHESTTIRSRPRPLWDDDWLLIVLVVLLSTEWSMRKWFRLL